MANHTGSSTRPRPATERFWEKVNKESGRWWNGSQCWEWIASGRPRGYGQFFPTRGHPIYAHRFAYELLVAPIPPGMTLDHRCVNPACVNPAHLEVATRRVNALRGTGPAALAARQTHCKRGHPFDATNTRIRRDGSRQCRECDRLAADTESRRTYQREYYRRRKGRSPPHLAAVERRAEREGWDFGTIAPLAQVIAPEFKMNPAPTVAPVVPFRPRFIEREQPAAALAANADLFG